MDRNKTAANICKDLSDIYARLFDHRPFVSGEIRSFVNNFETKREGDHDSRLLLKAGQQVQELQDNLIQDVQNKIEDLLPEFLRELSKTSSFAEETVQRLAARETDERVDSKWSLRKEERQKRWEESSRLCGRRIDDIDSSVRAEEERLVAHYKTMEDKLHLND